MLQVLSLLYDWLIFSYPFVFFFAFFYSGENVKEFFRRVAAITFEQAILGELESRGTRLTSPQIGTGGVLSKYSFTLYLLRNVC